MHTRRSTTVSCRSVPIFGADSAINFCNFGQLATCSLPPSLVEPLTVWSVEFWGHRSCADFNISRSHFISYPLWSHLLLIDYFSTNVMNFTLRWTWLFFTHGHSTCNCTLDLLQILSLSLSAVSGAARASEPTKSEKIMARWWVDDDRPQMRTIAIKV